MRVASMLMDFELDLQTGQVTAAKQAELVDRLEDLAEHVRQSTVSG